MLQFLAHPDSRFTIPEQCQMVIEGGCAWIQLSFPKETPESEIIDTLETLIPLCTETSTFLVVEDRPDLGEKFRLHGVHLSHQSAFDAAKIREELGPHAIIGKEIEHPTEIEQLKSADIDYITIRRDLPSELVDSIIQAATESENILPVVMTGRFSNEELESIRSKGVSGVCIGQQITEAEDPVGCTSQIIDLLHNQKK